MRNRKMCIVLLFVMVLVASTTTEAEDKGEKRSLTLEDLVAQTICPVMGGEIDKTVFTDHQGQRVYFCCAWCIDKFKEDPELSYSKAVEGKVLYHNIQTVCPVSADPIDRDHFRYYRGRGLFFCGEECAAKFDAEPEKYLKKMTAGEKKAGDGAGHELEKEEHDHKH